MNARTESIFPVVDLQPYYQGGPAGAAAVAEAIGAACRELGFLVITGHGIAPRLIAEVRASSTAFFALPEEVKRGYGVGAGSYRGYIPMATEALSLSLDQPSAPDLKEVFNIGPLDADANAYFHTPQARGFFEPNRWPAEVPALRPALEAYYRAMTTLATDLMRMFATALGLEPRWFDPYVDRHITAMSVLRYPPPAAPPLPGQLRAGAHTDYGSLTILQRDNAPGGLEIELDGEWIAVPDIPGSLVVNLGDLMSDWTGGMWRSTMHRVTNPPPGSDSERMSLAFFHQPNYDAVIQPLPIAAAREHRFAPFTSGEHVNGKVSKHRSAAKAAG